VIFVEESDPITTYLYEFRLQDAVPIISITNIVKGNLGLLPCS
jgi:hypothetical protein